MAKAPEAPQMYVWYTSVNGVRVPRFLVPAASKHAATEILKAGGHTLGALMEVEQADPADLLRLTLPGMVLQLGALAQLLGVVAQDAAERIQERAKGRLGLMRGN